VIVNSELLACADQIARLVDDAGSARKARDDLPGRHAERDVHLARIQDHLRQLDSDLPPERAVEALPGRALLARTRQRINEHKEHIAAARAFPAQIAARTNDLADLDRELNPLPPAPDTRTLEALLQEIRAGGDPAVRLSEAERRRGTARRLWRRPSRGFPPGPVAPRR